MRKLIHSTTATSIVLLSLTLGGCFWNPPELSLAEAGAEAEGGEAEGGEAEGAFEAEAEGGEAEGAFEAEGGFEAEAEGGEAEGAFEAEGEFEAEAEAEGEGAFEAEGEFEAEAGAEGEGGESESASREALGASTPNILSLTGNYALEFTKTTGQNECAQFGEVKDLEISEDGLMTGELYYSGSRGGPFRGRVRANGTWSAIGPDEGYKFEGSINDEEMTGSYTAPAPVPTEEEASCEGTIEGFKTAD